MKISAHTLVLFSFYTALALILSWIETFLPLPLPVPGAKIGLANLITLLSLYTLSVPSVFFILCARILLSGFLFGSLSSILYALAGGMLSFAVMVFLYRSKHSFSLIFISMIGAMAHNTGQLIIASAVVESKTLFIYYFPFLLIVAVPAGLITGSVVQLFLTYLKKHRYY